MTGVLFAAPDRLWRAYEAPLTAALAAAGVAARLGTDLAPGEVDYIVFAPGGQVSDFTPYTRARAVLSLWAGVERILANPTLRLPVARMVDTDLTQGMTEWVAGHVLRHHLGMDAHLAGQDGVWRNGIIPPYARDRSVTVLGLGALGRACAETLNGLGFAVTGWSRRQKDIPGVSCLSGAAGLEAALARAEIAVLLLPRTPETDGLMDAAHLAALPQGAVLLNPGRGALIDDAALLAALDSGHLAHATLDVFRTEPLPPEHAFWAHPGVTVTPHIASETRPESAARVIAENVRRGAAGEPLLHLADLERGY